MNAAREVKSTMSTGRYISSC